jgi:hypothetical protein
MPGEEDDVIATAEAHTEHPEGWYFTPDALGVVGYLELMAMFHHSQIDTGYRWTTRGVLPPPDGTVSGKKAWRVETILRWAHQTGRPVFVDPVWLAKHAPQYLPDSTTGQG